MNFNMDFEINEEFSSFKSDVMDEGFVFGCYLDETSYEDDYSHNDIYDAIEVLAEKMRDYLHNNYPNKFIVSTGWCVHVMTPDRARQSRLSERSIEECLVR